MLPKIRTLEPSYKSEEIEKIEKKKSKIPPRVSFMMAEAFPDDARARLRDRISIYFNCFLPTRTTCRDNIKSQPRARSVYLGLPWRLQANATQTHRIGCERAIKRNMYALPIVNTSLTTESNVTWI